MKNENEKRELQVHISKLEKQTESLEAEAATLDMQIEWTRSETEHAVLQEKRDNIYSECAELKLSLPKVLFALFLLHTVKILTEKYKWQER